jgi:hypothetical protein
MYRRLAMTLVVGFAAISASAFVGSDRAAAAKACTKEYVPVCGLSRSGEHITYGNACQARAARAKILHKGECVGGPFCILLYAPSARAILAASCGRIPACARPRTTMRCSSAIVPASKAPEPEHGPSRGLEAAAHACRCSIVGLTAVFGAPYAGTSIRLVCAQIWSPVRTLPCPGSPLTSSWSAAAMPAVRPRPLRPAWARARRWSRTASTPSARCPATRPSAGSARATWCARSMRWTA